MKRGNNICYFLAILIVLLISTDTSIASSLEVKVEFPCNGTIGECMGNELGDEFLMESDVSQRILAGSTNTISYNGLKNSAICNAKIYGGCIKQVNGEKRACTYYNKCKH